MLQLPLPIRRAHILLNSAGPTSSTNPHAGSPPTFAPSRFATTSDLPQSLPRLPPNSAPSPFPTTSTSGTHTAGVTTCAILFSNHVILSHSHRWGYVGRSPKLYIRYVTVYGWPEHKALRPYHITGPTYLPLGQGSLTLSYVKAAVASGLALG